MSYRYSSSSDDVGCWVYFGLAVFAGLLLLIGAGCNAITINAAVERFEEIADTDNVEVVRHSNNTIFFGDTHDVTFELEVDGEPKSGRCTAGTFSPMVCRIYDAGSGD